MTDIAKCRARPEGGSPTCAERHRCWLYLAPTNLARQVFAEPLIERGICRSYYPMPSGELEAA